MKIPTAPVLKRRIQRALKASPMPRRAVAGKDLGARILKNIPTILAQAQSCGLDSVPILHGEGSEFDSVACTFLRKKLKAAGVHCTMHHTDDWEYNLFDERVDVRTTTLIVDVPERD